MLGIEVGGAARDGRGDARGQRRQLRKRRPQQGRQRLERARRERDAAGAGPADGATGGRREAHERNALGAAARAGGEPRGESGQAVQLELEGQQQRVERDIARAGRIAVEHVEQPAERGEHARRGIALGEQPQQRLAAGAGDAGPLGLLADGVVRRDGVDAGDRVQLPRPSCSTSATWLNGSSRAPTRERVRRTPLATAPTRPREGV